MALAKLNRLDLFAKLFGLVEIPRAVYREVVTQGIAKGAVDARTVQLFWGKSEWPIIEVPEELLSAFQPGSVLDAGETEVLALGKADSSALLLIDDDLARQEARRLRLAVKGTLGVLVQSFRQKVLTLGETEMLMAQIAARPDIWERWNLPKRVRDQAYSGCSSLFMHVFGLRQGLETRSDGK